MKKISLTILLVLGITLLMSHIDNTEANPGVGMRECWHGSITEPFQDFLGLVPVTSQCPAYVHPKAGEVITNKMHIEGDPACQNSELNPFE